LLEVAFGREKFFSKPHIFFYFLADFGKNYTKKVPAEFFLDEFYRHIFYL